MVKKKDVVKVNNEVVLINEVGKDGVHKGLEGSRGVTKAKGHDKGFKEAEFTFEGSFPFVTFLDTNVVITPSNIKFGEIARALEFVDKFWDQRKRCSIFNSNIVQIAVILDWAKGRGVLFCYSIKKKGLVMGDLEGRI